MINLVNFTKKNIELDYKIIEYAFNRKEFSYTDIINKLSNFASNSTILRHLKQMKMRNWIEQDPDSKTYRINPYIKTLNKDIDRQIKDGETEIKLKLHKAKQLKNKIEDVAEETVEQEEELFKRIMLNNLVKSSFNFRMKINDDIAFHRETKILLNKMIYSLLREIILMNPETWKLIKKPEDLNFEFKVFCTLENDLEIFELLNQLKKTYKKIGRIPHSLYAPFTRNTVIELPTQESNSIDENFHKEAYYFDKYQEELEKKKINDLNRLIENFIKIIEEELQIFDEQTEMKKFTSILRELVNSSKNMTRSEVFYKITELNEFIQDFSNQFKKMQEGESHKNK